MGSAIISGIVKSGLFPASAISASDIDTNFLKKLSTSFGINTTLSNKDVAKESDIIFLCVKPHLYSLIIEEIKEDVASGAIVVTIAAGQTLATVSSQFKEGVKIVRTMPNTPALINKGMIAICPGSGVSGEDTELLLSIFNSIGKGEILKEPFFDIFTGIAGSSPAYAFMFIEALGDAGVKYGLTKDQSLRFVAQTVMGAAAMVLETGQHPSVLKDAVCSPGGTTIVAVCELEKRGFRNAVISAVDACVEKSVIMSKK